MINLKNIAAFKGRIPMEVLHSTGKPYKTQLIFFSCSICVVLPLTCWWQIRHRCKRNWASSGCSDWRGRLFSDICRGWNILSHTWSCCTGRWRRLMSLSSQGIVLMFSWIETVVSGEFFLQDWIGNFSITTILKCSQQNWMVHVGCFRTKLWLDNALLGF